MSLKLLALAASTRTDSLNKRLLALAVAEATRAGAHITELDYATCEAPLYQGEENPEIPAGAARLGDALLAHDGLLLASPEYNWSIPAALKSLIDWLSVDPRAPLRHRHALLMCASPSVRGGILGLHQLSLPLAHLGVYVYPQLISIGDAENEIAATGLRSAKDQRFLADCVTDFVRIANTAAKD